MAAHSDDSDEEESFVVLGTPVPELLEGEPLKKPTTLQDLTARDKQGRRRFHGAFTGGFSAGYFNTVGTKEGFTPSSFVSSRQQKHGQAEFHPEDFMDEEDLEEHGIAPRKFTTVGSYTSQERKRKREVDAAKVTASSSLDLGSTLANLIVPEQIPIGIKLLQKMGWREGQGLGPRVHKKKKKKKTGKKSSGVKTYGCALPPSDESDSDDCAPANMKDVSFAPKDVTPISLEVKDNVHGLGYRGLDPSLALPSSHINLFGAPPVKSGRQGKGIKGQAFGVGAFEDEDEDIYTVDDMSKYDISMQPEREEDNNFGWTAPRKHGKQNVPVSYVGKLLEGFCLSSKPLQPKKKFPPPELPRHFRPQHWFCKKRATSHIPESVSGAESADSGNVQRLTAVDRGLMLGETPVMGSVFDLVSKQDKGRIEATKQAIEMTKSLSSISGNQLKSRFTSASEEKAEVPPSSSSSSNIVSTILGQTLPSKFKRPEMTSVEAGDSQASHHPANDQGTKAPLFQGSLHIQPFKKDPAKQERYDRFLTLLKQGITDPYAAVASTSMTEWEKSRERDEFTKASTMFRPLSAMMSSRFVAKEMIDDDQTSTPMDSEAKSDQEKAAEMKMFGKLTREELEWHPDKLLCRRFNVPNPYPESDIVGLPGAKRDKYSVFNFLNFGDYQPSQTQEPSSKPEQVPELELTAKAPIANRGKKPTMASIFKVLDDPDFHKPMIPQQKSETPKESEKTEELATDQKDENEGDEAPDQDLFRAIFKNSDSEDSESDASDEGKKSDDGEENKSGAESENEVREIISVVQEEMHPNTQTENAGGQVTPHFNNNTSMPDKDVTGETPKPFRSRWGPKSVFSVLDDMKKEEDEGMEQRLSAESTAIADKEEEEDTYGPRLPPSFSSTSHQEARSPSLPTPHFEERSRAQKSRREGSLKNKKEKKKKSKHKKDKKHSKKSKRKSSKSRRSHHKMSSSGSEADSESDVSDSEIVQRLKKFSGAHGLMDYSK